jgi:lysophospholipase L1-like esterase
LNRWSGLARTIDEFWLARGLRKLLFYHVRPRLHPPATGPGSDTGRFDAFQPDRYEENLRALVAETLKLGSRPLLMTLPTVVRSSMTVEDLRRARVVFPYFQSAYAVGDFLDLLDAYNRTVRRVAVQEQVPLLDLHDRFAALGDPGPFFYDTMHTNTVGMERIAAWLEEALREEYLLGNDDETAHGAEREARD